MVFSKNSRYLPLEGADLASLDKGFESPELKFYYKKIDSILDSHKQMISRLQKAQGLEMPYLVMDLVYRRLINLILGGNNQLNFADKNIMTQITNQQRVSMNNVNESHFKFNYRGYKKLSDLFESRNASNQPQSKAAEVLERIQSGKVECAVLVGISENLFGQLQKQIKEPYRL